LKEVAQYLSAAAAVLVPGVVLKQETMPQLTVSQVNFSTSLKSLHAMDNKHVLI
jgi:ribosomal protein L18E